MKCAICPRQINPTDYTYIKGTDIKYCVMHSSQHEIRYHLESLIHSYYETAGTKCID
jgi:hypothetical protein